MLCSSDNVLHLLTECSHFGLNPWLISFYSWMTGVIESCAAFRTLATVLRVVTYLISVMIVIFINKCSLITRWNWRVLLKFDRTSWLLSQDQFQLLEDQLFCNLSIAISIIILSGYLAIHIPSIYKIGIKSLCFLIFNWNSNFQLR